MDNEMYNRNHALFLELAKGFVLNTTFSGEYFYFKVSLEIPIPPLSVHDFVYPRYRIYQVGVYSTSTDDCYDLILPDYVTLVVDKFYELKCLGPESQVCMIRVLLITSILTIVYVSTTEKPTFAE